MRLRTSTPSPGVSSALRRRASRLLSLVAALLVAAQVIPSSWAATLLPNGMQQFADGNGSPYASGSVGMYVVGTLTTKTTWQDQNEGVANANPITLDSSGRAIIFGSGAYRQILKDLNGVQVWDRNVYSADAWGTSSVPWVSAGGTSDAITGTYTPTSASLIDGLLLAVRASTPNLTSLPTFNPDGLGAAQITKFGGQNVAVGEWGANQELLLRYKLASTTWELLNPTTSTSVLFPGTRNRLLNSAMLFDQRNEGAGVAIATGQTKFSVDQWQVGFTGAATGITAQQISTAGVQGQTQTIGVTVGTGSATVNAGDFLLVFQRMEGLNVSDLNFGSANAATISESVWLNSSINATVGLSLKNSASNRSFVSTCTLTAGVWKRCTTAGVVGDTTGTWLTTSGIGIQFSIALECGSTFQSTAGSWQAGQFLCTSGQTQMTTTTGATLSVTGAQFELGSTVTAFDVRPWPVELAMLQRYYEKSWDVGTAVGTATTAGMSDARLPTGLSSTTQTCGTTESFKVTKRIDPTAGNLTLYSRVTGASGKVRDEINTADVTATTFYFGMRSFGWSGTQGSAQTSCEMSAQWTMDAGL